jgi:tRNA pseudouridine38-40 synthase
MSVWKLILAYDGSPYHGWQVQPDRVTVQGTLAQAIERVTRERVLPQGSGRTDTGVHAVGQVASFAMKAPIPAGNFQRALNRVLPDSIRVLRAEVVDEGFHARHRARAKTYEYRIFPVFEQPRVARSLARGMAPEELPEERICPPMLAPFCWPCPWALNLDDLNRAAAGVAGTHDFTSFAAADPRGANPVPTPVRTIWHSAWRAQDDLLIYRVRGSGFLHHMVRNLVGTFVLAGSGHLLPEAVPEMLAARSRSAAGPTAPARGLFLMDVEYADGEGLSGREAAVPVEVDEGDE